MKRKLQCIASLIALFAVTSQVRADQPTAVMVPPHIEAGISDGVVTRAIDQLRRELADGDDHLTMLSYGQAVELAEADRLDSFEKPKGEADAIKCASADCAVWFRRVVNADLAVQLSIFNKVDEQKRLQPSSLTLVLVQDAVARWDGSATIPSVAAGAIEEAVSKAFEEAQLKKRKGVGPWLTVHGSPEGAEVTLDGVRIGRLPLERQRIHDAGALHVVTIHKEGYEDYSATIELRGDISHEELVPVDLVPLNVARKLRPGAGRNDSVGRPRPFLWDRLLGSAFAIAGATYLVGGIVKQAHEDECAETKNGACTKYYGDTRAVSTSAIMIGAGGAGLALSVLSFWLHPVYRISTRGSRQSAFMTFEGKF